MTIHFLVALCKDYCHRACFAPFQDHRKIWVLWLLPRSAKKREHNFGTFKKQNVTCHNCKRTRACKGGKPK